MPSARDLRPGPLTDSWLFDLARRHEVVVAVDQESAASQALRAGGVRVIRNACRWVPDHRGGRITADADAAAQVAALHAATPLDLIVYSCDCNLELAWHEPSLDGVTTGVALSGSFTVDRLCRISAPHQAFLDATFEARIRDADFVLSSLDPALVLGRRGRLPPWLGPAAPEPPAPSPADPRWVVVSALLQPVRDLRRVMELVADRIAIGPRTTVAVLVREGGIGERQAAAIVWDGCPQALRPHVVTVEAGADGSAMSFLERADLVVAVSRRELAIEAVAATASRTGALVLDQADSLGAPEPFPPAESRLAALRPSAPAAAAVGQAAATQAAATQAAATQPAQAVAAIRADDGDDGEIWLLEREGTPRDVAAAVGELAQQGESHELLLLHEGDAAPEVARAVAMNRLTGADAVLWARPGPVYGQAQADDLSVSVVGLRRAWWPALQRTLLGASSLADVVRWVAEQAGQGEMSCRLLPAVEGIAAPALGGAAPAAAELAPAPQPASVAATGPAALPDLGLLGAWARQSRWSERWRLALPWRFGLLERAMRGRWQ